MKEKDKVVDFHPRAMVDDTKNPWQELYMPPVGDAKATLAGRCDSTTGDAVGALCANMETPWRNQSDFIRWAVERALWEANAILKDPMLGDTLAKRAIIILQLQAEEEGKKLLEMTQGIQTTVEGLLKEGDIRAAEGLVEEIRRIAQSMKSPRWRKKTLEVVAKWKELGKQ